MKTQHRTLPRESNQGASATSTRYLTLHAAFAFLLYGTASAELQVFDNRQEFETAAATAEQDLFLEDFEQFTSDQSLDDTPTSIVGGAVTVSSVTQPGWLELGIDVIPTRFGDAGIDSSSIVGNFLAGGSYSTDTGELRFELAPQEGRAPMIGFDYSGVTGSAPIANKVMGYRITYRDGSTVEGALPDRDSDSDGRPDDDGFVGFCDLENPIRSVVIVDVDSRPHPDPPDGGEVYAIDNVTASVTTPLLITSLQLDKNKGSVSITWTSTPGRSYIVERSTDLVDWEEIVDSIEGASGVASYVDSGDPVSNGRAFYRVREQSE